MRRDFDEQVNGVARTCSVGDCHTHFGAHLDTVKNQLLW